VLEEDGYQVKGRELSNILTSTTESGSISVAAAPIPSAALLMLPALLLLLNRKRILGRGIDISRLDAQQRSPHRRH
jgi:hypothetical protein